MDRNQPAAAGFYSLIQFCPDLGRDERANVGVFLMCPDMHFQRALVSKGNQRISRFFKRESFARDEVETAKQALAHRLSVEPFAGEADLRAFASRRANTVQLSEPRSIRVVDPQTELKQLYEELVGRYRKGALQPAVPELDAVFQKYAMQEGVEVHPMHFRLPLVGTSLRVQYAYQNGVRNLVKLERFSTEQSTADRTALTLGGAGQLLSRNLDSARPATRLVVVDASGQHTGAVGATRQFSALFQQFGVKFVPSDEIGCFAADVEREIRAHMRRT